MDGIDSKALGAGEDERKADIARPIEFVRARPADTAPEGPTKWLLFQNGALLLDGNTLPSAANLHAPPAPLYLGSIDDTVYMTDEVPSDVVLPAGIEAVDLRALPTMVDDITWCIAGYASQMLYWRRTSRHCPVCGAMTEPHKQDWGRVCPSCGHVGFPRVSPAVLILIHDGDRILLASKPGWDRYSILAGFVDSAETLEDCVRRETFEEVRLLVDDLVYVGSQSWPFPHQLMIGFTARYAGGEIVVDKDELDRAGWFSADSLPALPPPISLSRRMIDAWKDALR